MNTIILTPIAERDVHFYLAIADKYVRTRDCNVVFVSFYQPGNELIREAGFEVFDPYEMISKRRYETTSIQELESQYKTPPLKDLMLHELLTFGIQDSQVLKKKFSDYFHAIDEILEQIEKNFSKGVIVQELAGFVGPLTLFYAGMKRGWQNQFLEPSFFKGRIHFLKNSLFLHIPTIPMIDVAKDQVKNYLDHAAKGKVVVAATKDAHHYMDMGFKKVFNLQNLVKLSKKLYSKYVRKEKQEFEHIWNHSKRYLGMLYNRMQNEKYYSKLDNLSPTNQYVYFPFHVQLDFSLTIRCPDRLDQLGLIERILQNLPTNMVLLAKEHPASIGCLDQDRLEKLFSNSQFRLMHPNTNSYDILEQASGVLTINSKVGAEAISQGLPVISFGTAFYTQKPYCLPFTDWTAFKAEVERWKKLETSPPTPEWINFLTQVWLDSAPVELYDLSEKNIDNFVAALGKINP